MITSLTRRDWLVTAALLTTSTFGMGPGGQACRYLPARVDGSPVDLPADRYVPFGWPVAETSTGSVALRWDSAPIRSAESVWLRITSATDVRENAELTVKTTTSGKLVGVLDIRFAMYLQPFELPIASDLVKAVQTEGVTLTLTKGSKPFWFFHPGTGEPTAPTAYLPHLLVYDRASKPDATAWKDRLFSLESVQAFGWMEGCVMDGLHELSRTGAPTTSPKAKAALQRHLNLYFGQNSLMYANLNNQKAEGIINTVESILPFALLAQTNPGHPLLQTAIDFCQHHANADGVIADGTGQNRMLKTEECYTVSYPLAVLAKTLNRRTAGRPDLAQLALQTALARVKLLNSGTGIFQRGLEQAAPAKGNLFFENWSRSVVWYLLGLAKTLAHLPDSPEAQVLKQALQNAVDTVLTYQQPSGLWYCYMHQPETGLETSGTAGIAAALTYGVQKNLLPKTVMKVVQKAKNGLATYLTPDGYLTGTAQGNKGGDALQRNGFRVISPYTLGFMAHLDQTRS